jgi:dTMP kinase
LFLKVEIMLVNLESRGITVLSMSCPNRTSITGKLINQYLQSTKESGLAIEPHALHLLFSANRWEQVATINEALAQGTWVIMDRYKWSGMAYSKAVYGLDLDWVQESDKGLPKPDVMIHLRIDAQLALKRQSTSLKTQERYDDPILQEKITNAFYSLIFSDQEKGTFFTSEKIPVVFFTVTQDTGVQVISSRVQHLINDLFESFLSLEK